MWVGHYAPGFLLKQVDRRVPLWLLFLAVQFVDILWAVFILLGPVRCHSASVREGHVRIGIRVRIGGHIVGFLVDDAAHQDNRKLGCRQSHGPSRNERPE